MAERGPRACLQGLPHTGLRYAATSLRHVSHTHTRARVRVLFSDLYGRGYTDAPQTTYDVSLYVTQLALLLQYVGWDKADLAGISMVRLGPSARSRGSLEWAAQSARHPHFAQYDSAVLTNPF